MDTLDQTSFFKGFNERLCVNRYALIETLLIRPFVVAVTQLRKYPADGQV